MDENPSKVYFIIGVNGVGKTTLIPHLEAVFGTSFVVYDFDSRGVPNNADSDWRMSETLHWVQVGKENLEKGLSTIVCGFSKPKEIQSAAEQVNLEVLVCLLDANAETISKRILSRYTTPESLVELERTTGKNPEKFVADNVWVSTKFRQESEDAGYHVLDISSLAPQQVAHEVREWVSAQS